MMEAQTAGELCYHFSHGQETLRRKRSENLAGSLIHWEVERTWWT